MNYAKSQPDMAIMAVNTFVRVHTFKRYSLLIKDLIFKNYLGENTKCLKYLEFCSCTHFITFTLNYFEKDCEDSNPLIRALAVRTMGCIRVDKIIDYLCQPLRNCLKDEDPYVRKTAAVCVAKLHDINAQLVEDQGFLDQLRDLLSDSNPMVHF